MTDIDRSRWELEFEDDFDGNDIDPSRWIPAYLPQWSSRAATRPRYSLRNSVLTLRIDEDQAPWSPEFDGTTYVSNLQTAVRSGPLGSRDGQHRFADALVVREEQQREVLYAPSEGLVEVRMRATPDPDAMAALWLIGIEDSPEQSGELCVAEIFGRDIRGQTMKVGVGVHPHHDPDLPDDFTTVDVPGADEFHEYAAAWSADGARFYVDGRLVRSVARAPAYPLMLMLDLYAFARPDGGRGALPKSCEVDWVRGWRPAAPEPSPT
ncbi:glycoside hydrolase family 16 protein [Microbacterium sp. DT81.1]|uniref:glycoside hydrolase family 16 protein n=1 Tax=Microbacterium sp. DT81.1 TaxID=3393413 RepID=UPI003CF7E8F4